MVGHKLEAKQKSRTNTRELVLEMLVEITGKREYSHIIIRNVLDKHNYLPGTEKSFIKRLTDGTLERMIEIDYIINQFSNIKINKMKPVIRNILRMAVYQIIFMDKIPDSAACNEAVKLTQKKKFHQLKGFVNGVLRNIVRNKEALNYPNKETNPLFYYSICYSMPEWIIKKWLEVYDEKVVEAMLEDLLAEHRVTIRVDENLSTKEQEAVIEELRTAGIQVENHPYLPYGYQLSKLEGLANIPSFIRGKFTVQDISSMLVAEVANPKTGDYVIDVCAAPGGKALHIATKLKGSGKVDARDVTERKVEYIQENMERLSIKNMSATVVDALVEQEDSIEKADILIADLPCSGLGIMGKKRDIKYNISEDSIEEIISLQKNILKIIHSYVKKGGHLIYSTCTINQEENQKIIEWFSANYPYELESIDAYLPSQLQNDTTKLGYLQMIPGTHESDGFFMARLKRIG